ncbi:uncharacterized protein LOC128680947 [Plodia interpunctella]|uniref:uncharacterized protein LOC128680947 n=1 Tax=Plodia interpunctella TaxID=58824 RepID=UPI002368358F|nr:uncharacterized protein LOC128680947 [Plodia interpunctella]
MVSNVVKLCLNIIIAVNIRTCLSCPSDKSRNVNDELFDAKAIYKSGSKTVKVDTTPMTLERILSKLKQAKIFNKDDTSLTYRDKKELNKLFSSVEIMMTSRNRQPSNVQSMFASLRLVERALKKQLKEGQISESLAAKFHWENLLSRHKREKPSFKLDEKTKMRVFDVTY